MNLERYTIVSDIDHVVYEFLSEGPKGAIRKLVFFQEIGNNVFNLFFGDWDEFEEKINEKVRSNNNDRDKVLATVASTVIEFLKYHPDAIIQAKGFTASRTRLYQMGIIAHLDEIRSIFNIEGYFEGKWCAFERGRNYSAFSIEAKK